jgi:hypothetical protein
MLNPNTRIVQVISTDGYVEIAYVLEGEDSGNRPVRLIISPHKSHINIHLSNLGENRVKEVDNGANTVNIVLG